MKKTSPTVLFVLAVVGAAVGWLVELAMLTSGRAIVIPPVTFAAALALIGILVIAGAIPVLRSVNRTAHKPVDPFYATRVVLLAKAASLTGAFLSGGTIAIVVFLLTRPVVSEAGSVSMSVFTAVGAVVLMVGGLVAERMCTIPPEDEDKPNGTTARP